MARMAKTKRKESRGKGEHLQELRKEIEGHRRQAEEAETRLQETQERLRDALQRLDRQIHEIASLQTSFLPARFPPVGGLSFAALCRPCAEVGGDYYDVFRMPDGRVCITIADVTGHGARAAVLMAMTRSLTRAAAAMASPPNGPAWMLNRINDWLREQLADTQFVTMWMGLWNPLTASLEFARAGHPAGVLCRPNERPQPLVADGVPPLGMIAFPFLPPETHLALLAHDRVVLYTDGLTESYSAAGHMLGEQGLLEALAKAEGLALESVPLALYIDLERFVANAALTDDVSLLILERRPTEEPLGD